MRYHPAVTRTKPDASEYVPHSTELSRLRSAAAGCRACDLYRDATQTVFGSGPERAKMMMVGEQPGDEEDRKGEPFVGPAGRLLDRAFTEVPIDRDQVYLTNAVKHFKFVRAERGKRRLHKTPSRTEIVACRPWLLAELAAVQPDLVVLLGAVAAQSLLGASFRVTERRGQVLDLPEGLTPRPAHAVATLHPSSVLRAQDRHTAFEAFGEDLRAAVAAL
jgi:DNA polymerase